MKAAGQLHPGGFRSPRRHGGFTLFETVIVIGMLAAVSLGILAIQPQVFKAQTTGRDQFVGFDLTLACAEKLLAQRRNIGYAFIDNTLCSGMGGLGGYAAPTVALTDSNGNSVTSCTSATCTASIIVAKTTTPAATLTAITLQFSAY